MGLRVLLKSEQGSRCSVRSKAKTELQAIRAEKLILARVNKVRMVAISCWISAWLNILVQLWMIKYPAPANGVARYTMLISIKVNRVSL